MPACRHQDLKWLQTVRHTVPKYGVTLSSHIDVALPCGLFSWGWYVFLVFCVCASGTVDLNLLYPRES
jgi:hypothetical protein